MAFGAGLTAASAGILLLGTNPLTAALGIGNVALYSLVYTPLKQRSTLNTAVGAIVGAIPPVMGWAAATGGLLAFEPMLLGAALFWWQFPHFYSLAWNLRKDYARGGYAMVPVLDVTGGKHTAWLSLRSTIAMSTLPVVASVLGVTSPMFAVEGVLLNGYFLRLAWRFYRDPSDSSARALFRASLWYLPLLLVLMVFHSRRWHREEGAEAEEAAAAAAAGTIVVASAEGATGAVKASTAAPGAAAADAAAADAAVAVASKCPYGYKAAFNARDLSELAQRGVSQMHAWGRAVCLHELMVRQHLTSAYDGASAMGRAACRLLFGGGSGGAAAAAAAAPGTEAGAALGESSASAAAAAVGGSEHAAANPAAQLRARCPVVLVEAAVQPAAALVQHAVADAAAAAAAAPATAAPAASGAAATVESR
jgi:protoheme IX farnesyltransferase